MKNAFTFIAKVIQVGNSAAVLIPSWVIKAKKINIKKDKVKLVLTKEESKE